MGGSIKGLGFYNVKSFARKRYGEVGWQKVFSTMTEDERNTLLSAIPFGWYSLDLYVHLLKQLQHVHGANDPTLLEQVGRFSAEEDLTTIHKMFMRFANPGLLFDHSMKLWSRFQDTGVWHVERGHHRAVGTLTDWGCADVDLCRELRGYIEVVIAHGNGKHARVTHPKCRALGAIACEFVGTWL
jgi:hypothetical protein